MDSAPPTLAYMSKDMDSDFRERMIKAAKHAEVPFTPQSLGTFLGVDRRKAAVWMAGSLPRPSKLFEHADRFGVDPRWYATGEGDMLPRQHTAQQPQVAYDARIKTGGQIDAEKLLVLIRTFLDTDDEGRIEMLKLASEVRAHGATSTKTRRAKSR